MKRLLCIITAFLLLLAFSACETSEEVSFAESSQGEIKPKEYYFLVYNGGTLSADDKTAVEEIKGLLGGDIVEFDVESRDKASDIYRLMKDEHQRLGGELKGIQILGDSRAVASFELGYKMALASSVEEGEKYLSDYFFSNFNNDADSFDSFNVYDFFENSDSIDFYPEWSVARLPLTRGKYSNFIANYKEYKAENQDVLTVAVSSPIFKAGWYPVPIDDIGYFLQRARDEWKFIDEMKLYGNTEGLSPTTLEIDGTVQAKEWTAESKARICEYYIYGHASEGTMMQTVFSGEGSYYCKNIITSGDINTYLAEKPYFLNAGGCNTAKNMRGNIIQIAMHGKCIGAFASTSLISNVDIDCMAEQTDMENGYTYHSIFYHYLKAVSLGESRANAYLLGQQAVAKALKENIGVTEDYRIQPSMHNLLSFQNFGIIE